MFFHGFIQLCAHCADRAKGAARALKDVAQLRSVELPKLLWRQAGEMFPLVADVTSGDAAFAAQKLHRRFQQRAFSAAAFSHNAQNLAGSQGKAHILRSRFTEVGNIYMVIDEKFFHFLPPAFGVGIVPDGVAQQVKDDNRKKNSSTGTEGNPGTSCHQASGVADHAAPFGSGRLGTQS